MDPFDDITKFEKMMRDMLEGLFGGSRIEVFAPVRGRSAFGGNFQKGVREPLTDIDENKSEVIITMELPGASKDAIEVDATSNGVEINAKIQKFSENKNMRSSSFSHFKKFVSLPSEVNPNEVKAKYKNGILEIKLKKVKTQKGKKVRIE